MSIDGEDERDKSSWAVVAMALVSRKTGGTK